MGGGGGNNRPIVHNPQQLQSAAGAVTASPLPKGSSLAFLGLMGKELHKGLSHFVQVRGDAANQGFIF